MKKDVAKKILIDTERGYDLIADKFSQTRKKFWSELEFIRDYIKKGDSVLDFGCGNGRLYQFLSEKTDIDYIGVDVSEKLIEKAKQLNPEVSFKKIESSQTSLSFKNNFFNAVYSVAVFHHIPSKNIREKLAKEIFRITKKEGYFIVTVWNLYQKRYFKNILENWKNKLSGGSDLDWKDCYISFTDNEGKVFQRFHHAFTKREVRKLFEGAGFKTKKCEIVGGRNIVYVGKK